MKRTVLFFFLIASAANAFLTASVANAISYEGYKSEIDGVGLWALSGYNGYPSFSLRFDEHPEFAAFCDGKNKLYVYEKGQQGFVCKTVKWDAEKKEFTDFDASERKEMLNKYLALVKKGEYIHSEQSYEVLLIGFKGNKGEGIYTVSKKRLAHGKWTVSAPTKDEMKSSAKIALNNQRKIKIRRNTSASEINYKSESVIGYSDKRIREMNKGMYGVSRENDERYTVKITTGGFDIIIVPTLYITDNQCCDIISTVILKKNNEYKYLGHINGWLLSVGADIDSDAVPEVITSDCGCSESCGSVKYLKIYPVIKKMIHWECG